MQKLQGWSRRGFVLGMTGLTAGLMAEQAYAVNRVEKIEYKGWKDSYLLTNGAVELVVVPQVGRVMHYGFADPRRRPLRTNVLWENADLAGKPIPLDNNWYNVGGDKIWPWPQDAWGWPPPAASDKMPHRAEVLSGGGLRLISEVMPPWGVRIIREIRLASRGTAVYFTNRFLCVTDGDSTPCAPWTVTQVPATPWVMARLLRSASELPNYFKPFGSTFRSQRRTPEGILIVERDPRNATKIGTEADILASFQNDTLFTVQFARETPGDNGNLPYVLGDRAQFYGHPDNAGVVPYIEMEMTAPLTVLRRGETITLNLVWELRKLPVNRRNPAGVIRTLVEI